MKNWKKKNRALSQSTSLWLRRDSAMQPDEEQILNWAQAYSGLNLSSITKKKFSPVLICGFAQAFRFHRTLLDRYNDLRRRGWHQSNNARSTSNCPSFSKYEPYIVWSFDLSRCVEVHDLGFYYQRIRQKSSVGNETWAAIFKFLFKIPRNITRPSSLRALLLGIDPSYSLSTRLDLAN